MGSSNTLKKMNKGSIVLTVPALGTWKRKAQLSLGMWIQLTTHNGARAFVVTLNGNLVECKQHCEVVSLVTLREF